MYLKIKMPEAVEEALNVLKRAGYNSYIVGGCVRDSILNADPKDYDITTEALPEEIIECFKKFKTIQTGLKHGTVTVIINRMQLEITTFRIDGEYKDNRRPDQVFFTNNIALDLERRDFTINAMAYNRDEGIVDLNGGFEDLTKKQIRCVGNPDKRFNEDGLRILRALRFASVLNFNIEEKTSESIFNNKELLKNISLERIKAEFDKLLLGENFYNILNEYRSVIEIFIPQIIKVSSKDYHNSLKYMSCAGDDLIIKLSLFLCNAGDIGNSVGSLKSEKTESIEISKKSENNAGSLINNFETSKLILKNLKYDNKTIDEVSDIVLYLNSEIRPDKKEVKRWLNKLGEKKLKQLIKAKKSNTYPQFSNKAVDSVDKSVESLDLIVETVDNILKNGECYNLKTLSVNGEDLKNIGIKQGTAIGKTLNQLLNLVLDEKLENKRDILIEFAKNKNNDMN